MSGGGGRQSIAFRVMRLCRPTFNIERPLRFDLSDLIIGEDVFDDESASPHHIRRLIQSQSQSDLTYTNRFILPDHHDPMGGMLVLPQAFGAIYLGETFCSYISINNSSSFEVRDIIIKAEIQTERQRIMLLDTTKTPVETIRAGGRYDFIVEHDVKELGAHTLVCTALYSDGDAERKYLPQYFKFMVSNPLSVRTKVRVVKVGCSSDHSLPPQSQETTYLEACLENNTKSNLYMDQVDFEPSPNWSATLLKADDHHFEKDVLTREIFKPPVLIKSGGGIHNYLYLLKSSLDGSAPTKFEGSNVLGKLQITWRTNLGEPGRLQTQHILGNTCAIMSSGLKRDGVPITHKEIELKAMQVPSVIILEKPFIVNLRLTNLTEDKLGPFEVLFSLSNSQEEKAVMVNGLKRMALPPVEAFKSLDFQMNLIAMELGMQKITGITVYNMTEKKNYDPLPDIEVSVHMLLARYWFFVFISV
ncbi:trafficking protein particle complex subunit 13-like protein isoform X1 [Tanacetum coccineum]